jgi:hypothetical protein
LISDRFPAPDFTVFSSDVVRIVESQEQVATTKIVADLAEQDLLEHMLENSKPGTIGRGLHYLLSTPFRYPPLKYGNRFGSLSEPSLFYASLALKTCLQECAYYRFIFWYDMESPPPNPVQTQHTVFGVQLATARCVDLRVTRYDRLQPELRSAVSYDTTQALGAELRAEGAELIVFESARGSGDNVAAYSPHVFCGGPKEHEQWNSELTGNLVMFSGPKGLFRFERAAYSGEDGELLRVHTR